MSSAGVPKQVVLSTGSLAALCAVDNKLFAKEFFPRTIRQETPPAHDRVWAALEDPKIRLLNLKMARDWAKTTLIRLYNAKRIAYGLSRTIMYIAGDDAHSSQSIMWLRSAIASWNPHTKTFQPTKFGTFYGLSPGRKWNETELEIKRTIDPDRPAWIIGLGVTGNVRGVNFEDYRPDLICCDDVLTDESAGTKTQRAKTVNLIYGAVKDSLAPATEEPNAKLVINQTPIAPGDLSDVASKDPAFTTIEVSCWTPETQELDIEHQVSSWPERHPSETLRADKRAALAANRYSIFAREKEVRIVTQEDAAFRPEWLQYYKVEDMPRAMDCILVIDPVPPPSEAAIARGLAGKDYECQMVLGRWKGNYYVLEYATHRGHEPDWTVATFMGLARRFKIKRAVVEGVAYQRVLKWILEQAMAKQRQYYAVMTHPDDKRKKTTRIVSTLAGPTQQGKVFVRRDMSELILQYETFSEVREIEHDDVLDALSMGLTDLINPYLEMEAEGSLDDDEYSPRDFDLVRLAP